MGVRTNRIAMGTLLLCTAVTTACVSRIEPAGGPEVRRASAQGGSTEDVDVGARNEQAVVAAGGMGSEVARASIRVVGERGPIARARVASRSAAGAPVDLGMTDQEGVVHLRAPAGGVIVAAAPGYAAGARRGTGALALVPLQAPERSVVRLRNDDVVLEVVRGATDADRALPRASGLSIAPPTARAPAPRFVDVQRHAGAAHIEALASRGIVAGDPDGRFRPDDALRRAELIALVLRASGIADEAVDAGTSPAFVDVDAGDWFAAPLQTARALDVVAGDPDGRFRPRDRVTRAELAAVLVRVGQLPPGDEPTAVDVGATHWARTVLGAAQAWCGLLDVDDHGALRPDVAATRADAAVALSRLLSCAADRQIGPGTLLARHAADFARATFQRHHTLLARTGLGSHYGDESPFHLLDLDAKRAYIAQHARPGTQPLDPTQMTRSSCIEYAMSLAEAGFRSVQNEGAWQIVDDETRRDGLHGTMLATQLVRAGWHAIYVNADTGYHGFTSPDEEHSYSLAVARAQQSYYDVPLSGALLDWDDDEDLHRAMDALPFGVLVLRGGFHVVGVADGLVHELAHSEGPDGHVLYDDVWSGILEVYANDVYGGGEEGAHRARAMWGSGVLVIPPGVELDGVSGL